MRPHERIWLSVEDLEFFRNWGARWNKIQELLQNGVGFLDPPDIIPTNVYIGPDVTVGKESFIWPGVFLLGDTHIGEDCHIEPGGILQDVKVGDHCTFHANCYIRVECEIGDHCELWAGARMYNSKFGNDVTAHSSTRTVRSIIGAGADMDSGCLVKDTEVGDACKIGPNAVIIGKSCPRRKLELGGRTIRILPGSQIPPGINLISKDRLTAYGDMGVAT